MIGAPGAGAVAEATGLAERGERLAALLESDLVERLAVLASFDPTALPTEDRDAVELVSDKLADRDGHPEWMLKERTRVDVLARVIRRGGRDEVMAVRHAAGDGPAGPLQRLLDAAIADTPINIDELDEDELVAGLHAGRWCTTAGSLGGDPSFTPMELERDPIEGRLALLETTRPIREITGGGCVGRDAERERLRRHLAGPGPALTLNQHPAMLVYGVGGVGKSTLVAQFVLDVAGDPGQAWAYLDLDRPSLSSYEPLPLLNDIIRQVGSQLPQTRRYLDRSSSRAARKSAGSGLESVYTESWRDAIRDLADTVAPFFDGRLVVIVDTFEELQREEGRRRDTRLSEDMHRMFQELSENLRQFRLVVSGRAPATAFLSPDGGQLLHVEAFRGDAAVEVLRHMYQREVRQSAAAAAGPEIDRALADLVVTTVGGSPLTLRVAARVLAAEGGAGVSDAGARAQVIGRVRDEFVRGFLYHRVLRHLVGIQHEDTEPLREVARASLALRHVTADLVRAIVLPAIGRPDLDADRLMAAMTVEAALAEASGGGLRLRDELRGPALQALRYDEPQLVDEVHRRAIAYYEAHPELPAAAAERLYHILATGLTGDLAAIDPAAARQVERSLADLPAPSRDLVTAALDDPGRLAGALAVRAREREVEALARRALDEGRLEDAEALLLDRTAWSVTTTLHRLVAQLQEARGDYQAAAEAAHLDVLAASRAREPERFGAAAIRHALLEERRRGGAAGAAVLTKADAEPWLGGHDALRLELHLNRLAMLERAGEPDQWLLMLDARAILQRLPPSEVRARNALVRLLAATLGREERQFVLEAVREVGLGETSYSTFLGNLAHALAEWDAGTSEPGSVSRTLELAPPSSSVEDLERAWLQAMVGSGAETQFLLDRAVNLLPPSAGVIDALRAFYLWWSIDPQDSAELFEDPEAPHFLDVPLDFAHTGVESLLRSLTGAYPRQTDLQVLASRIGLDLSHINWRQSVTGITREMLNHASERDLLAPVVREVLHDPVASSFHEEIKDIVGRDWLGRHDITD